MTSSEQAETVPPASGRAIAWVDGRVLPAADATVPLTDEGFLRGDAVFEAMLVRGGRTHARDAHLQRLRRSAKALDLPLPPVDRAIADLLAAFGARDGALRLIVTRGGAVRGILGPVSWPATISLAVVEAPWRTAISGVKTLSYAVNQWALRQANTREADDALVVDGGLVHELPSGAVVLVHDGEVSSPDPQRLPILDSITVRSLAEVVEVARTVPDLDALRAADEVFVVSATRPVLPVHAVLFDGDDEVEYPAPGPVTERLRAAFAARVSATLDP
ncbi:aminotransferase class IV [Egicoccus halophilus]|uniref:4-amino-4-deoxychorismate lyase n=1 Tax=Egicoccus halophilus TaxID=1670830 RepID=A0A8J3EUT6_9ACTN|nr:aminotransferase class IV [Egicoccus halophilus]GGI08356.1 4-amino-4-deoxychorismate lyase [Egicoccus halophilus]